MRMRTSAEGRLDQMAATRGCLGGVLRGDSDSYHPKYGSEIVQPLAELVPRCINNRLGYLMGLHHVSDLHVLIRHDIVK